MSWTKILLAIAFGVGVPSVPEPAPADAPKRRGRSLLKGRKAQKRDTSRSSDNDTPGWQTDERGRLPVMDGRELIAAPEFAELMASVRESCGETDSTFERYFAPLIVAAADFLQLFPASRQNHHDFEGGLLFHSLDVARRMLIAAKDPTEFIPPGYKVPVNKAAEHRIQIKQMLLLFALSHDLAKIRDNMTIHVVSPLDPTEEYLYSVSPDGTLFSQTLVEFVRTRFPLEAGPFYYRLSYASSRRVCQDEDIATAMRCVRNHAAIDIEREVFQHYLPIRRARENRNTWFRKSVYLAYQNADAESSREDMSDREKSGQALTSRGPVASVLRFLAEDGRLDQYPDREGCLFLSLDTLKRDLSELPPDDSFEGAYARPNTVEAFVENIKNLQSESELPFSPKHDERFHLHEDERGLYLVARLSMTLLGWQKSAERSRASEQPEEPDEPHSESADAAADTDAPPDDGAPPPEGANPSDSGIDVSSHGVAVPPPPKDDDPPPEGAPPPDKPKPLAKTAESRLPTFSDRAQAPDLASLPADIRKPLRLAANRFELINNDEITDDPQQIHVVGDSLVLGSKAANAMIFELVALGLDTLDFVKASEAHCAALWVVEGGALLKRIVFSPRYTQAILDQFSDSPLLIGQFSAPLEDPPPADDFHTEVGFSAPAAPEPKKPAPTSSKTGRTSSKNNKTASKPKRTSVDDRHKLTAQGFLDSLVDYQRQHPGALVAEGNRLAVPLAAVDAYIDHPVRRGELINLLKRERLLIDREPQTWYLDRRRKEVARCLSA